LFDEPERMTIDELDTPCVLIDLDIMEHNITEMQARCDAAGVAFRPHVKTHKIPDIARMQLSAGAVGIAAQKVTEAEVFAAEGIDNILIPYNIVGPRKTARLLDLAIYNRVTVSADSETTVAGLSEAARPAGMPLRVMVELESEMKRAGASAERAIALAQKIDQDEHLHFAGLLIYPSMPASRPILQEVLARLDGHGIGVDVVSGGGISAAMHLDEVPEISEIRVGTYVFNDWQTVTSGAADFADCAMMVRCTVVSRPDDDRAIIDGGSKTFSSDSLSGLYGYVVEYPDARLYKLNEEHGYLDVSACESRPKVGDMLHVIPVHTCVVTNLHNVIFGHRDGLVEKEWPVAARGCVW
jgi:D-serine deaminase-like pyridoxal phosphate-dependent protein